MFKKYVKKFDDKVGAVAGKIADSKTFNAMQKVMFLGAPTTNELAAELEQTIKDADKCLSASKNTNSK